VTDDKRHFRRNLSYIASVTIGDYAPQKLKFKYAAEEQDQWVFDPKIKVVKEQDESSAEPFHMDNDSRPPAPPNGVHRIRVGEGDELGEVELGAGVPEGGQIWVPPPPPPQPLPPPPRNQEPSTSLDGDQPTEPEQPEERPNNLKYNTEKEWSKIKAKIGGDDEWNKQALMAADLEMHMELARKPQFTDLEGLARVIQQAEEINFQGPGLRRCKGLLNTLQAKAAKRAASFNRPASPRGRRPARPTDPDSPDDNDPDYQRHATTADQVGSRHRRPDSPGMGGTTDNVHLDPHFDDDGLLLDEDLNQRVLTLSVEEVERSARQDIDMDGYRGMDESGKQMKSAGSEDKSIHVLGGGGGGDSQDRRAQSPRSRVHAQAAAAAAKRNRSRSEPESDEDRDETPPSAGRTLASQHAAAVARERGNGIELGSRSESPVEMLDNGIGLKQGTNLDQPQASSTKSSRLPTPSGSPPRPPRDAEPSADREQSASRSTHTSTELEAPRSDPAATVAAHGVEDEPAELVSGATKQTVASAAREAGEQQSVTKLALSEEEAGMNGSPEGELYAVDLLESDQISPCESEEEAVVVLESVETNIRSSNPDRSWHLHFETLTLIRRLAIHHADLLEKSVCAVLLIPYVAGQCGAARSSVARNALMAMEDLVATCGSDRRYCGAVIAVIEQAPLIADTLLTSSASSKPKVIRNAATAALETASGTGPLPVALAPALAKFYSHKNKDVAESAVSYMCKCIRNLDEDQIVEKLNFEALLPLLHGALVDARSAAIGATARDSCVVLCAVLGTGGWAEQVETYVPIGAREAMVAAGQPEVKSTREAKKEGFASFMERKHSKRSHSPTKGAT